MQRQDRLKIFVQIFETYIYNIMHTYNRIKIEKIIKKYMH
jgi:hypothetical protein